MQCAPDAAVRRWISYGLGRHLFIGVYGVAHPRWRHSYGRQVYHRHPRTICRAICPYIGDSFVLMHDNARPHKAQCVNDYLRMVQITALEWPAYSPDLNPIEHLRDCSNLLHGPSRTCDRHCTTYVINSLSMTFSPSSRVCQDGVRLSSVPEEVIHGIETDPTPPSAVAVRTNPTARPFACTLTSHSVSLRYWGGIYHVIFNIQ